MALSLDGTTGISATGSIISSGGIISATGNIYGGNIIGTLVVSTATFSGNVTGGNLLTGGIVSATGNITGSYILGNGSQLTGVDATQIINGTSNAKVVSSGGNIAVGIGGTANVAVFATTGAFVTGVTSVSGNVTGGNLLTAGLISATGTVTGSSHLGAVVSVTANVTGGNILTAGLISAAGTITTGGDHSLTGNIIDTGTLWINTLANGNINLNPNGSGQTNIPVGILSVTANVIGGNILTGGLISAAGTVTGTSHLGAVVSVTGAITGAAITGSSLTVSTGNISGGNIVNNNANGVGNIGSATVYFNTVFGKATTAQYADLAELYSADAKYAPGTVLVFGGNNEVTISTASADPRAYNLRIASMADTLSCWMILL